MDYPDEFPLESRAAVAAERYRAEAEFEKARGTGRQLDAELRKCILRPFGVFVQEACKLGQQGIWSVDNIESLALEFLRLSTSRGCRKLDRSWIVNDWGCPIKHEVQQEFEKSEEWRQFRVALLHVAEVQACLGAPVSDEPPTPNSGAQSSKSHTAPSSVPKKPESVARKGAKRGPKPNHEITSQISEIVARVASGSDWRSRIDDVCEALDEKRIPFPKRWRERECRCWADYPERSIVIKAIQYRLNTSLSRK